MSFVLTIIINSVHWLLVKYSYPFLPLFLVIPGYIIYIMQMGSQFWTAFGNPGIPNRNNYLSEEVVEYLKSNNIQKKTMFEYFKICRTCNILITYDKTISHCDICGICVLGIVIV